MEQEHLRAAMAPDWPAGMTWVIEGMAPHFSRYALEERHNTTAWTGEIELRVVENDGSEALVEATGRSEKLGGAPFAWSISMAISTSSAKPPSMSSFPPPHERTASGTSGV